MEGSYFDESFFGANDIENEAYQSLEPSAMPPAMPLSMPPFSSQPAAPLHPMYLTHGMENWESAFTPPGSQFTPAGGQFTPAGGQFTPAAGQFTPAAQFGLLPPDPRQLFVTPEMTANDNVRSQAQGGEPLQLPAPGASTRASTRRTSSSSSESQSSSGGDNSLTDITPPDQSGPRRRGGSKKTGPSEEEDRRRRKKFLERNRIAASKCRDKKKAFMTNLEHDKLVMETKNNDLHNEVRLLTNEVADLKYKVMAHARCDDPRINKWVASQADEYVNAPAAPLASSQAPPAPPVYTGYNPPGPPILPTTLPQMSPVRHPVVSPVRHPMSPGHPISPAHPLPSPYHALRHNSFSMGYDPMAVGDGQTRPLVPMAARESQNGYDFIANMGNGEGQNRSYEFMGTGAGSRQNSMAYSHSSSIFTTESYTNPSTPAEAMFPGLHSPTPKQEENSSYDGLADNDEGQPPYVPT